MSKKSSKRKYTDGELEDALDGVRSGHYKNSSATYAISRKDLDHRLKGILDCHASHESQQILSPNEERVLVKSITELTRTGFPMTPQLAREIAESMRQKRLQSKDGPRICFVPISKDWIMRFKSRHPDIEGVWARKIDAKRHNACNLDTLKRWFGALEESLNRRHVAGDMYNA